MTHPAWGCLIGLAKWAAAAAVIAGFLQARYDARLPGSLGVSIGAGLLLWAAANLFWGAWQRWRERAALAHGVAGERPTDGWTVQGGTLEARGATLRAPFDGAPCLAYSYEVREDRGQGRRRTILTHFRGVALAPAAILTASGSYPLLAVPDLEEAETGGVTQAAAIEGFRHYASRTTFISHETSAKALIEQWTNDDGAYRNDVAYADIDQVDLSKCQSTQQYVCPGARVTVMGPFSTARGSIVPSAGWQASPRITVGDPASVMKVLGKTARNRLILAIVAGAAAACLVAAFVTA